MTYIEIQSNNPNGKLISIFQVFRPYFCGRLNKNHEILVAKKLPSGFV
jgi:hypothetical protein